MNPPTPQRNQKNNKQKNIIVKKMDFIVISVVV